MTLLPQFSPSLFQPTSGREYAKIHGKMSYYKIDIWQNNVILDCAQFTNGG